ncbi:MAG: DASS family sodium-coupled anion symporter [Planctomycetes bacterium]|nr:DASS family sodium-coupled anion symporter [Planctomycetota bacterium]
MGVLQSPSDADAEAHRRFGLDRIGFVLGPAVMLAWFAFADAGSLRPEAFRLAGILLLTIIWWVTEPIPIAATGLLAAVLCVILGAIPPDERAKDGVRPVLSPFADPAVFFLLGGLFIGRAMMKHGLDRRLALSILATPWAARSPGTLLATVGVVTTFISMWVSNTATAAMMCPVVVGLISVLASSTGTSGGPTFAHSRFATALLLMVAFGASVGGIATPIGTATNVFALGFLKRPEVIGQGIDFLHWMAVGVPAMVVIFLGLYAWLRITAPAGELDMHTLRTYLRGEYDRLGPWKRGEVNTLAVFLLAIGLWVAPGMLAVFASPEVHAAFVKRFPEEMTALVAVVLLFLVPTNFRQRKFTLEGDDFRQVDWGTVLLFGAALSLGGLMFRTGLAEAAGRLAFTELGTRDPWVLTAVAILAGILLSEVTSNTAAAAALLPVVHRLCVEAGVDPLPPLLGVTFGASFGSSLPVSTPPNAIVYGTGMAPVRRMIPAGLGLDIVAGLVIWVTLWIAWQIVRWSPLS